MERAILLQIEPTGRKEAILADFSREAVSEFNLLLSETEGCERIREFHHKVCHPSKDRTHFNIQVVTSLIRDAWRKKCDRVERLTVKFNVPRNCKTFSTKSLDFVEFGIRPRDRAAVPIVKNRNWQRYNALLADGWACKTYGLTSDLQIVAYLSKGETPIPQRKNVLGIDFNAKNIAVTILSPQNKVLRQSYFGKRIWIRRKEIMRRRAILQSYGNEKALRRQKTYERNFVGTNLGQTIAEIMRLALEYDADISIENLKRFKPKGRRFNRTVMRMPFRKFREILASRCFDRNVTLDIVDSWHTSKYCNHCGAVAANGHSHGNYALFRCKECGVAMNSDRNASRNIALKCLLERNNVFNQQSFQISNRGGLVSDLGLSDETGLSVAVQHSNHLDGKPTGFSRG